MVIGCVIRVYIGSCVATSQSGYLISYFGEHCEHLRYIGVRSGKRGEISIVLR